MPQDSFLSDRQLQILELRKTGHSQAEIARRLGTSRANISATESTARKNILKAENTIKLARILKAETWIKIEKDTDLNEVPRIIYEKAGREKIWVNLDTPTLVGLVKEECKHKIRGRRVISEIMIAITKDGDIITR
jgi:Tfx family DNA-binding protein